MVVYNPSNVKQQSTALSIAVVAIYVFEVWKQEGSQAYLQSSSVLTRDVLVLPKEVFILKDETFRKLLKPLYDLTDSCEYWLVTISSHLQNYPSTTSLNGDLVCFVNRA